MTDEADISSAPTGLPFTDTHCHIHESDYPEPEKAYSRAMEQGIGRLICVGTDEATSRQAAAFADTHHHVWASLGLHPHEASHGLHIIESFQTILNKYKNEHVDKIVAIGECGLDYFYEHSPRTAQIDILEAQLQLAHDFSLPVIFHVRDAKTSSRFSVWQDFWPIVDNFPMTKGVLHSFTDTVAQLEQGLGRGYMIGVNGISTFSKADERLDMFRAIPPENLLFETDSPFLTPVPFRGKPNEPAFILPIVHHMAKIRGTTAQSLSEMSEINAKNLFRLP